MATQWPRRPGGATLFDDGKEGKKVLVVVCRLWWKGVKGKKWKLLGGEEGKRRRVRVLDVWKI